MTGHSSLKRLGSSLAIVFAIGAFGGCASPEARYYTLSPAPEDRPVVTSLANQSSDPLWIEVTPVRVPERINRVNLVFSNSSGRATVLEQDRWSAPLPDEFRDALSQQLQTSLGALDTYQRGRSGAKNVYQVSTEVVQIDAVMNERVTATVTWTVRRLPDGPVTAGRTQADLPAPGSVDRVVVAYQQIVRNTAYDIAAALRAQRS